MSMLNTAGYQAYQKNKYGTVSPHKLITLLYEGAINHIGKAKQAIQDRQVFSAHRSILKSQEIVSELLSCLNEDLGGEIAKNMKNLYLYVIDCLVQANLRKQVEPLDQALDVLLPLKSAWDQIGKEVSIGT